METARLAKRVWAYIINLFFYLATGFGCGVLFLTLFITALTIPALLLRETKIGADAVFGIQGRYFLPFLPVFMFLVGSAANKLPIKVQNIIEKINMNAVFLCFTVVSYICVYCMMQSFWRAA